MFFMFQYDEKGTSPMAQRVKNLPAVQEIHETWVHSRVRKITWRRAWMPRPVIVPGESHGFRCLAGYSPEGRRVRHNWATKLACMMKKPPPPKHTHTHTHTCRDEYSVGFATLEEETSFSCLSLKSVNIFLDITLSLCFKIYPVIYFFPQGVCTCSHSHVYLC